MGIMLVLSMAVILFLTEVWLGSSTCAYDGEIHMSEGCSGKQKLPRGEFFFNALPIALAPFCLLWLLTFLLAQP